MEVLEKSWDFKIPFSRPGKVTKFSAFIESFGKAIQFDYVVYVGLIKLIMSSMGNVIFCKCLQCNAVSN